jgi:hypothetical protein
MEDTNETDIPRPTPTLWHEGGIALLWNAVQNWDEEVA